MPLLVPLAIAWGLPFLTNHHTEQVILFGTLIFACVVLLRSCFYHHRNTVPLLFVAAGAMLFVCKGILGESWEPILVTIGGIALISAHLTNLYLCKKSNCQTCDGCEN